MADRLISVGEKPTVRVPSGPTSSILMGQGSAQALKNPYLIRYITLCVCRQHPIGPTLGIGTVVPYSGPADLATG